ncbi:MAG: sensor domain-containing diguanylate cyclase [Aquificota bacterium]|nr:sensor domain-containing diguanylate cyclase [Aquificota bacterium]
MRFRKKIFLMFTVPPSIALAVLFLLHMYMTLAEVREIAEREGTRYVETVSVHVADLLYYGDYSGIASWLESIPDRTVVDVLVVSREGFVIASKRKGLVLFERFPRFEDLKDITDIRVEEDPVRDLLIFAGPVKLDNRILGYVVSKHSFSGLEDIILDHFFSFAAVVLTLLVLTYLVAYHISARISGHIGVALSYLNRVSRGEFDLPEPPETGDEFEDLFEGIRGMARKLKEVHVSRDFYQNLINSLAEGLLVVDPEGRVLEANASACGIFGCSQEELKGNHISALLPDVYRELLREGSGRTIPDRIRIRSGKGEEIYISVSVSSYDGIYILLISDVTKIARYEERLKELAERDHLTGVYNRRASEGLLNHELEKAKKYRKPLSVIMFDIDHFKKINDTYGHQTGDEVLRRLVNLVRKNLRKTDIIARWGGEEFIVLLPGTDLKNAVELAERLRRVVERADFGKVGRVTVSFGVAGLKEADTVESIISRVDKAVYRAKRKGRNRVEVAD